jgi:hypothetical protein
MGYRLSASCLVLSVLLSRLPVHGQSHIERELRGRLVSIERGKENPIPVSDVAITAEFGISRVTSEPTGKQGVFRIPLPTTLHPGQEVTLVPDKSNYAVFSPYQGKQRIPYDPEEVLEVRILPKESPLFWSQDRIDRLIARFISESADRVVGAESRDQFEEFRLLVKSESQFRPDGKKVEGWRVSIVSCPIGSYENTFIQPSFNTDDLKSLRRRRGQDPNLNELHRIGDTVRSSILDGKLEPIFRASLNLAWKQEKGLRLVVLFTEQDVAEHVINPAELPIEAIRLPYGISTFKDFAATNRQFAVSRGLDQLNVVPPHIAYAVRVLVVAPSPKHPLGPSAEEQCKSIRKVFRGLAFDKRGEALKNGPVHVEFCDPPTYTEFQARLRTGGPWHIVHFVGHGGFQVVDEDPTPQAHLIFEREADHESDPKNAEELAILLNKSELSQLRLVVLTACSSAAPTPRDPGRYKYPASALDGVAQHLLRAGKVSAVVAMQFDLEIPAAEIFAREFYASLLADGQDIDVAVTEARQELALGGRYSLDSGTWITPAVYTRCLGGRVFEFMQQTRLAGTVTDADTFLPLQDVQLTLKDVEDINGMTPTVSTDEKGRFRFRRLPPGPERRVSLVAQRPGYLDSRTEQTLGHTHLVVKLSKLPGESR